MIICSIIRGYILIGQFSDYFNFAIGLCALSLLQSSLLQVSYGSEDPFLSGRMASERVVGELENPTGMAFLGSNDILVIEKNTGNVLRILDGVLQPDPLLKLKVANQVERGLLGIAVSNDSSLGQNYVFLYYTEAKSETGEGQEEDDDDNNNYEENEEGSAGLERGEPAGNRLYRYELSEDGNKLVNPKLLLDLPYLPGPAHNGGVITIGPDDNLYVVVGNLLANAEERFEGSSLDQNIQNGDFPDGRGGILRVTQDGQIVDGKGILGDEHPLDMYYAYGIRNSFGLAFDPLTGKLWDTENGGKYDEINLVEPGFNSGWEKVIGKASLQEDFDEGDLVDFDGRGKYSDPEFSWEASSQFRTAPTSIVFMGSDRFGEQYANDMLVGDVRGNIYHFKLDHDRTKLLLEGPLVDQVASDPSEIEDLIFAKFPGVITDLKVGPDGYLYVLLYDSGELLRIVPTSQGALSVD
jgi:aldose sugar dehydrogenase